MKLTSKNGFPRLSFEVQVINNGVKIMKEMYFPTRPVILMQDLVTIARSRLNKHAINHNFEAGVYLSHLRVTRKDDCVLAVGLGSGSTLISTCKILDSRLGGSYTCIEASKSQIQIAEINIGLNTFDKSTYNIINGFVGNSVYDSWGNPSRKQIDINDFEFDILEMDCEGSELSILEGLNKIPKYIIVELHPNFFDVKYQDFNALIEFMDSKGFKYYFAYGHNGDQLTYEDAGKFYNINNDLDLERVNNYYFGVTPIVVTFKSVFKKEQ
jgi:hypothetical protein